MPDTPPWMSAMLGQLLDVIEADPLLQARIRRLCTPAAEPSPATVSEPVDVEWVAELTPDRFTTASTHAIPTAVAPSKAEAPKPAPAGTSAASIRPPGTAVPAVTRPAKAPPSKALPAAAPGPRKVVSAPSTAAKPAMPDRLAKPTARTKAGSAPAATGSAPTATPPKPAAVATPKITEAARPVAPFVLSWLPPIPAPRPLVAKRQVLAAALRPPEASTENQAASRLLGAVPCLSGPSPGTPSVLALLSRLQPVEETTLGDPRSAEAKPTDVHTVARLLADRVVLMIGGECRPEKQESLRQQFGLKELRWLGTREHASTEPLLKAVADPEVSLVLLLIKLSSHSYGDVAEPCKRRGIPLVRVPAGYSANQLAHQILEQAGERLKALPPAG